MSTIFSKHCIFWCLFLDPNLSTNHLNTCVQWRWVTELGPVTYSLGAQPYKDSMYQILNLSREDVHNAFEIIWSHKFPSHMSCTKFRFDKKKKKGVCVKWLDMVITHLHINWSYLISNGICNSWQSRPLIQAHSNRSHVYY